MPLLSIPKLCGADAEVGNFLTGDSRSDTSSEASRMLLKRVAGIPANADAWSRSATDPQDWGRLFLPGNGGCIYIDLEHLELCPPETLAVSDFVACWHAMLSIAAGAQRRANSLLEDGRRVHVLVNNSDGLGMSYGSHLNFLVTRTCWDDLFLHKWHPLLFLAAHQVSSIVFTGQGKVGAENGAAPAFYQLSQRADFIESLCGPQTTYRRPLVNSRDEALCGAMSTSRARLHVIFYDNNLCHAANLLKVGTLQIVLAMIEAGCSAPDLILDNPLEALHAWSRDPSLKASAALASGGSLTAVEMQMRIFEKAQSFAESGRLEGIVPEAGRILELWGDTLLKLKEGNLQALSSRLDWVLKLLALRRAIECNPPLRRNPAALKHIDHLYSSLDASEGLYWAYERAGVVDRLVPPERVEHFTVEAPGDTRAWTRALLLRRGGSSVQSVDWDAMRFRTQPSGGWSHLRRIELADPLAHTRAEFESTFRGGESLDDLLDSLEALHQPPSALVN